MSFAAQRHIKHTTIAVKSKDEFVNMLASLKTNSDNITLDLQQYLDFNTNVADLAPLFKSAPTAYVRHIKLPKNINAEAIQQLILCNKFILGIDSSCFDAVVEAIKNGTSAALKSTIFNIISGSLNAQTGKTLDDYAMQGTIADWQFYGESQHQKKFTCRQEGHEEIEKVKLFNNKKDRTRYHG